MTKYGILAVMLGVGICFNAQALVQQSASEALSYRNVFNKDNEAATSGRTEEPEILIPEDEDTEPAQTHTVNLVSSLKASLAPNPQDTIIVKLNTQPGSYWDVRYNSSRVHLVGTENAGSSFNVELLFLGGSGYVYFDMYADGKNEQNQELRLDLKKNEK